MSEKLLRRLTPVLALGACLVVPAAAWAAPEVTHLKSNEGSTAGGAAVRITGVKLTGPTAVKFGANAATSFKNTPGSTATSIDAVAPAGASGTVDVTVTTAEGTSAINENDNFYYKAPLSWCKGGVAPCPHEYKNGALMGEAELPIIGWGTITLALTKPPAVVGTTITCKNALAGEGHNPAGGDAGQGKVQIFATFDCEQTLQCPLAGEFITVTSENTPWPTHLTEEVAGTVRTEGTEIEVDIVCHNPETGAVKETHFDLAKTPKEKGQRPHDKNGTSALHPSFAEFDAGSGELEIVGSKTATSGKTEGEVKSFGYEEQELITIKTP